MVAGMALAGCSGDEAPIPAAEESLSPSPEAAAAVCPLSGQEPSSGVDVEQPAIAVKIENNPVAYPLSGLEKAEVVYEEEVEGGATRFMALFHCTDVAKAGPVRSARIVDPAIMTPITKILAAAGGNDIVRKALDKNDIITLDEKTAGAAMRRVDRPGIATEHTLYGDTAKLRRLGAKKYQEPPPAEVFQFGDLPEGGKNAKAVTVNFSGDRTIEYRWTGGAWARYEAGEPFVSEAGGTIKVDNVIVEQHTVKYAKGLVDSAGNPSIEIVDVIGTGKAALFRDGQAFVGRWVRKSESDRVVFQTKAGEELSLHPGNTWIELLPNEKGEVKGSFSFK